MTDKLKPVGAHQIEGAMTSGTVDGNKDTGLLDFSPIADLHQASMLAGFVGLPEQSDGPIIIDEDELLRDFSQWLEMVTNLREAGSDGMNVYDADQSDDSDGVPASESSKTQD
ncbi:MAG: hypothetical protein K8F91_15455 [Candidatus Obscuribacterales bacterium]|nr:hypothetical protein [Candidatus Obscuribacterales bacterium]